LLCNQKLKVMNRAQHLRDITQKDKDGNDVVISLFHHLESNAVFAIDTSYLEQVLDEEEDYVLPDIFNKGKKVELID
jgi:hypothetical protein